MQGFEGLGVFYLGRPYDLEQKKAGDAPQILLFPEITFDADRFLALGDLDLGDARFLEQFDQLLDLANVHSTP